MSGVFRDPVAYRVRGSLIALRRDQARHVLITVDPEPSSFSGLEGGDRPPGRRGVPLPMGTSAASADA
jgi:hypothetical protein